MIIKRLRSCTNKSILFAFTVLFLNACSQGGSATVSTEQKDGGGINVPSALLVLPDGGTLNAYIRVDAGDRQQMTITGTTASISLTGLTEGSHTFTIEFEYIAIDPATNNLLPPIMLASASETMIVGPGTNTLDVPEANYNIDGYDDDGDGISNLAEIENGTNPYSAIFVSPISGNTGEDGSTASFVVALTSLPSSDVTLTLSSSNLNEGTVDPATITITPANWIDVQTVTVTGVDDDIVDGDTAFTIIIDTATSSDPNFNGIDPADVNLTNLDNDNVGVSVSAISGNTTEAQVSATFTVVLDSQPTADVSFDLSSSDETEGLIDTTSIVFGTADWNIPQTITVTGVNDDIADGNQLYTIQLAPTVSTDPLYQNLDPADVNVTNIDDDSPGFNVSPISDNTSEAGGSASFTVALTSVPTADVSMSVSSADTTEGDLVVSSLTFTPANWDIEQTVVVTGVNDDVDDGDQLYVIELGVATSADGNFNGSDPSDVSVTNIDDDTAGFIVSSISGNTTEAGGTATFTVALSSQPTANVSVGVGTSNIFEGQANTATLIFTSVNWNISQTVTVTGNDDNITDGNQVYSIQLNPASSSDSQYNGLNPVDVSVTNVDNELPPAVSLSINNPTIAEAGGVATVTATLNHGTNQIVTVILGNSGTAEAGSDYVMPSIITIPAGDLTGTTNIAAQQDTLDEPNETVVVDINMVTNGTESDIQQVSTSITDDDQPPEVTLSINTTSPLAESGGSANLTASLSAVSGLPVTVNLAYSGTATPNIDYSKSDTIVITAGDTSTQSTITALSDTEVEGTESIVIDVDSVTNGIEVTTQQVNASIADNDVPVVNFNSSSQLLPEFSGTVFVAINLNQVSPVDVSIPYTVSGTATGGGIDHNLANGTFDIPANSDGIVVNFLVTNDAIDEPNETIVITMGSAANVVLGTVTTQTINITDDDTAGINVSGISGNTTEAGGTATFTVALNSQPTANVSIGVSSSDLTEGNVNQATLTFTGSNWNNAQTVTVTGIDDNIVDGDQSYSIILAAATSSDSNYNALNPNDFTLINIESNLPPTVSNIQISGIGPGGAVVGDVLSGSYNYADVDGDVEGVSTYRWLRDGSPISNETTLNYTVTSSDLGTNITFEVTPVAISGTNPGSPGTASIFVSLPTPGFPGPLVSGLARYLDINNNGICDANDQLIIPFDQAVFVNEASGGDFSLPVAGNSLGAGATVSAGPVANEVTITLGTSPSLKTRQNYSGNTALNSPSGIDVSASLSPNAIESALGDDAEASFPIDIVAGYVDSSQSLGTTNSRSVKLGDIDNDGDLDMVVAIFGIGNRVYANNGTGIFTDTGQSLGENDTLSVALGDLDNDGDLDIATANFNGQGNRVYINNGAGIYIDTGQSLGVKYSWSVALGDVDGDKDLDMVVSNGINQGSSVYLNNGGGVFTDSTQSLSPANSLAVTLGDIDSDGDLDIVIANSDQANSILSNNGSGVFTDTGQAVGTTFSRSVTLGDVDGDGDIDIIEANYGQGNRVYMNSGAGNFGDSGQLLGSSPSISIELGDVDSDGDVDMLVANSNEGNRIYINNGAGIFSDLAQSLGTNDSSSIAIGDVDRDGDLDMVVSNNSGQSDRVYFNSLSGTWGTSTFVDTGQSHGAYFTTAVAIGDVDRDGDLDYVAGNAGVNLDDPSNRVYLNDGSANYSLSGQLLGSNSTLSISLADVDNDGDLDMFVGNSLVGGEPNQVYLNNGSGMFTDTGQSIGNGETYSVAIGDLDNDGDLDAIAGNNNAGANRVYLNDGSGTFSDSGQSLGLNSTWAITLGDLDGDGDLDLVSGNNGSADRIYLNNGEGIFTDSGQLLGTTSTHAVLLGDLDSDGDLDLIVGNSSSANQIYLNNGAATFTDSGQALGDTDMTFSLALFDIDGDGDLDFVAGNYITGVNKVYLNNGYGAFSDSGQVFAPIDTWPLAFGDLDSDGDLDLLVGNYNRNGNQVYLNE